MRTTIFTLILSLACLQGMAQEASLKGYRYVAFPEGPEGDEWNSPENLALNKEQPRAWFFPFSDVESARRVLPENSIYWQSLNGDWKFHWAPDPDKRPGDFYRTDFDVSAWDEIPVPSSWNVYGIQRDGSLKYGVPIYVNQPVIFQHSVKVDDWRGGVMRTPPSHWTTYQHRNEVGSYRRGFTIPKEWDGREVFIQFDGVDSFFYLWINGRYVGFSKNSRNAARFNITRFLQKGENVLAVEVYRSSDGSFLESQDMFRLPGIFRTVGLYATSRLEVNNLVVLPDLDATYTNGSLKISADIRNFDKKTAKEYHLEYTLYKNRLYSEENVPVSHAAARAAIAPVGGGKSQAAETVTLALDSPDLWSAEFPYRYTLVAELKDKKGRVVETVSTSVGFRKVEIRDTPAAEDEFGLAGRYYYINGKPVKLKGVNRHETNPEVGHAITRAMMEQEVMLMKQGNINHVRNSHYTTDPYWYYLCNKYGIYLEDEANIESHQYYYGEASLSHPAEWEAAHVARVLEMVHSHINHPSIVIWSLGNEAGPGKNFVTAYNALKQVDTSRPVQYERNNRIVDMGSNQYPSIAWIREAVKGNYNIKYPFHVSEYAHSMGNACGNLVDYWEAMESTNFFCGGAIWDWVDQAIYHYDKQTGTRYLAYGGDFGDTPNDGQFVMNGIVFADLTPKPQYQEVKKVYQNIAVKPVALEQGRFEIYNKYYFKDLSGYIIKWFLYENGTEVESGTLAPRETAPRSRETITIPYAFDRMKSQAEYFVKIQFLLKEDMPWAPKRFVQAQEQFLLKEAAGLPLVSESAAGSGKLSVLKPAATEANPPVRVIRGDRFEVAFDLGKGTIHRLTYGGQEVISTGNGPELNAFRAFVNNDNWAYSQWFGRGLHNLQHRTTRSDVLEKKDGTVVLSFTVESQAPHGARIHGGTSSGRNRVEELTDRPFGAADFKFTTHQVWTVYPDGSIELQASITSNDPAAVLPRLGYQVRIPKQYGTFTYYGRGPADNYPDRKSGLFIERYRNTVAGEFVHFPKPQDMANHEEVRWCALTNDGGTGAVFVGATPLSVAALPYSGLDMVLASHPFQLPPAGDTYLYLGVGVTGLGGNSCGQGPPLEQDRVFATPHRMGFIIRPAGDDLSAVAGVRPAGEQPIAIVRDRAGNVTVSSNRADTELLYTVGKGKVRRYTDTFALREGGEVTAWYKKSPAIQTTVRFEKMEAIQVKVVFASSEETGSGDARHLTDGDPNTIWHSMHSVTVAKHPHWVDLDAGEEKAIKGFSYLPRQNGRNGNVKDYTIQLSTDGKTWGEPVAKGRFENNSREQRVLFEQPVKARYIRFTALSEQSGQDFASGAELMILSDE